jgi:thiamine monophosphate kinase
MLRRRSLETILEDNGCFRKSLRGLKNDYPEIYAALKAGCMAVEAYTMLEVLENRWQNLDQHYSIWLKSGLDYPIVLEIKEEYPEPEVMILAQKLGIAAETLQEISEATH